MKPSLSLIIFFLGEIPHGHGVSFYISKPDKMEYKGSWVLGKKGGIGKIYFPDGNMKYYGNFTDGMVDGYGTHYYENGNIMFQGLWNQGEFYKGKLLSEGKQQLEWTKIYKPKTESLEACKKKEFIDWELFLPGCYKWRNQPSSAIYI